jgi:sugar/nucleoside kinase (ribokinase family)
LISPDVDLFYFDRINRGSINLAKLYKANGGMIFFEPSNMKDIKKFDECISIADIVKFSEERIEEYQNVYSLGVAPLEIQTLGNKGLRFRRKGVKDWIEMQSFQIDDVTDTAGAGDWLTCGILSSFFKIGKKINELSDLEIIDALKFGQVLSSMNCTFEGARGLMYNISRTDLILCVEHVLSLSEKRIPRLSRPKKIFQPKNNSILISSLF